MLKAALFDMDGLMFDTERIYDAAWQKAGTQLGIDITAKLVTKMRGTNELQLRRVCIEAFGEGLDYNALYSLVVQIGQQTLNQSVPHMPYLIDILDYLKARKIKMAVASSTNRAMVEKYLNIAKVRHYFDAIIGGDMVTNSKPLPDIYLAAAQALGVAAEDCVALEDSYNGVRSANAAGCTTIMVPDLDLPTPEIAALCDNISCNLNEVIQYLASQK